MTGQVSAAFPRTDRGQGYQLADRVAEERWGRVPGLWGRKLCGCWRAASGEPARSSPNTAAGVARCVGPSRRRTCPGRACSPPPMSSTQSPAVIPAGSRCGPAAHHGPAVATVNGWSWTPGCRAPSALACRSGRRHCGWVGGRIRVDLPFQRRASLTQANGHVRGDRPAAESEQRAGAGCRPLERRPCPDPSGERHLHRRGGDVGTRRDRPGDEPLARLACARGIVFDSLRHLAGVEGIAVVTVPGPRHVRWLSALRPVHHPPPSPPPRPRAGTPDSGT
jgi:hypothetical protein